MNLINQEAFWEQHTRFLNEPLVTESPNSITHNLSQLAKTDLTSAYLAFLSVELKAIDHLAIYIDEIAQLRHAVHTTLNNNGRIFLLGCGASGRLAVLLKRIHELSDEKWLNKIIAVNSAGDTSLIKSVEQFEDKKEFGIRQLLQLGYTSNDLVIGLTASGESPFILSAVEYAYTHSNIKPWLIYNNPTNSLLKRNSNHILHTIPINTLALNVGEMALTGSTRLQATTAMLIAVKLALNTTDIQQQITTISQYLSKYPFIDLIPLTIAESDILKNNQYILYQTNDCVLGLSLLADITERSPTFNLTPFENLTTQDKSFSPFYLALNNQTNNKNAWKYLLGQEPVCLNWKDFPQTSSEYIYGFDISINNTRDQYLNNTQYHFKWIVNNNQLQLSLKDETISLPITNDLFMNSLIYKIALNTHSTLMLGRLDYFMGNLMLSLKPSNFKLIDRAIRYIQFILDTKHQLQPSYKQIADYVFQELPSLKANQSIVIKVVDKFISNI